MFSLALSPHLLLTVITHSLSYPSPTSYPTLCPDVEINRSVFFGLPTTPNPILLSPSYSQPPYSHHVCLLPTLSPSSPSLLSPPSYFPHPLSFPTLSLSPPSLFPHPLYFLTLSLSPPSLLPHPLFYHPLSFPTLSFTAPSLLPPPLFPRPRSVEINRSVFFGTAHDDEPTEEDLEQQDKVQN